MAIPTTYTGQSSGAAPIYQGGKTEAALGQGIQDLLGAKRQDVAYAKQEEAGFIEAMQYDPIALGHQQLMDAQMKEYERFSNEFTNLYRERGGRLTTEDKALMRAAKSKLVGDQAQRKGQYDLLLQDIQRFSQNPSKYDPDAISNAIRNWNKPLEEGGGTYMGGGLEEKGMSYDERLSKVHDIALGGANSLEASGMWTQVPIPTDKGYTIIKSRSNWTEDKAREAHKALMYGDSSYQKGVLKDWGKLTETQKKRYLDEVDMGVKGEYTDTEKDNAVLLYDYERSKNAFFGETQKIRSQSMGMTEQVTDSTSKVLSNKRGTGVERGTDFSYQPEGLSGEIGKNIAGVTFNMPKYSIGLPAAAIDEAQLPEGIEVMGDSMPAKLKMVSDGKAEFEVQDTSYEEVDKKEATTISGGTRKLVNTRDYEARMVGGEMRYYKKVPKTFSVVVDYDDVSGLIEGSFPDSRALIQQEGLSISTEQPKSKDEPPKSKDEPTEGVTGSFFK
jgi:hypothetical protein